MSGVAGAAPVRDEDAFDVERVATWLRENAPGEVGIDGIPEVQQFVGGASNLTYLLRYGGGPDAGGRDLILRRPPTGTKAKGAHDMRREHDIQAALAPVFPAVPRMVAFCGDDARRRVAVLRDGAHRGHHPAPRRAARARPRP